MLLRNYRHLKRGYTFSKPLILDNYPIPNGHYACAFFSSYERNKIDDTIRMLREDLETKQFEHQMRIAKKPNTELSIKSLAKKAWGGVIHTYHGFRLFFYEVGLSLKYLWKMRKETLTRKERQQLIRTVADLFRLVPFSVFIIVPCMEILLPFYIKIFPKMMPTPFQDFSKEELKNFTQMKAKIATAKFLQNTLEEIALTRKNRSKDNENTSRAYEFIQFLKKVREQGGSITNADLFKYIKLFEDEFTIDYLGMPMLRALCRLLGISTLGTPEILHFRLNMKLRELKTDDKLIIAEGGVDVLSVYELQAACRSRGMRAFGLSEEQLRFQLKQWLELSMNDQVPPSLLLLTRAMYFPEEQDFTERLKTVIALLPKQIGDNTTLKLKEIEGMPDPKARLELLKSIEVALKQEATEAKERAIKKDEKSEKKKVEKFVEEVESTVQQPYHVAANEPAIQSIEEKLTGKAKELKEKQKLNPELLESLENLLHGSPEQEVKHDFDELKEKVIEHTEDLMEIGALANDYEESKGAKKLRERVHKIISKVDLLAGTLESRKREIKETVVDPEIPGAIEAKKERLVQIKDLIASLGKLKQLTGEAKQLEDTLKAMDVDVDGKVEADLILEVLEMLQKHKDVDTNAKEIGKLVELLKKEDFIEELEDRSADDCNSTEQLTPPSGEDEELRKLTASASEDSMTPKSASQQQQNLSKSTEPIPPQSESTDSTHPKMPLTSEFEPKPIEKSQSAPPS